MSDIKLSDLTAVQKQILLDELKAEQSAAPVIQAKAPIEVVEEGKWILTNALNGILLIPDLGIATPGGSFEAEAFKPFEVKDLSIMYDEDELRKSKYLRMLLHENDGRLLKGTHADHNTSDKENPRWVPRTDLDKTLNPLVIKARDSLSDEFHDPTSAHKKNEYGTGIYDQKLKELSDKDKREEMETRKS